LSLGFYLIVKAAANFKLRDKGIQRDKKIGKLLVEAGKVFMIRLRVKMAHCIACNQQVLCQRVSNVFRMISRPSKVHILIYVLHVLFMQIYGEKDGDGFYFGEKQDGTNGYIPCNMVTAVQVNNNRFIFSSNRFWPNATVSFTFLDGQIGLFVIS